MGSVDELLPKALLDTLQIFTVMAGILIMVFIVNPWMIIPTIILGIIFYYTRVLYLSSAQDIKRLEGISKYLIHLYTANEFKNMNVILFCVRMAPNLECKNSYFLLIELQRSKNSNAQY